MASAEGQVLRRINTLLRSCEAFERLASPAMQRVTRIIPDGSTRAQFLGQSRSLYDRVMAETGKSLILAYHRGEIDDPHLGELVDGYDAGAELPGSPANLFALCVSGTHIELIDFQIDCLIKGGSRIWEMHGRDLSQKLIPVSDPAGYEDYKYLRRHGGRPPWPVDADQCRKYAKFCRDLATRLAARPEKLVNQSDNPTGIPRNPPPTESRKASKAEIAKALKCPPYTLPERLGPGLVKVDGTRQWWRVIFPAVRHPADGKVLEEYFKNRPFRPAGKPRQRKKLSPKTPPS